MVVQAGDGGTVVIDPRAASFAQSLDNTAMPHDCQLQG